MNHVAGRRPDGRSIFIRNSSPGLRNESHWLPKKNSVNKMSHLKKRTDENMRKDKRFWLDDLTFPRLKNTREICQEPFFTNKASFINYLLSVS